MKVASFINNKWVIDSIFKMYPHVSFPDIGVQDDFLQENNLFKIVEYIEHDSMYKTLITLETPVLIDGKIYTVKLIDKSIQEINNIKWEKIRSKRNSLLDSSDIYVFPDRWERYDQNIKTLWSDYRQKLRDLPNNFVDPETVIWPISPV